MAAALAVPLPSFLGYDIPEARRSLLFILEDDPGEYQEKLRRVIGPRDTGGRIEIVNRGDFYHSKIPIDIREQKFREAVRDRATQHRPDLIVFDNLAQIIGAEYNDSKRVHELMSFCYELTQRYNAAIILAAHPKKEDPKNPINLSQNPDGFFESIMGSSHFINSTGNLWGIQRNDAFGETVFLGGRQRGDGQQGASHLTMTDDGWFELLDDAQQNLKFVLNTIPRLKAWKLLPDPPATFGYREGEALVRSAIASGTYAAWIKDCRRLGVVIDASDGKLSKKPGLKNP